MKDGNAEQPVVESTHAPSQPDEYECSCKDFWKQKPEPMPIPDELKNLMIRASNRMDVKLMTDAEFKNTPAYKRAKADEKPSKSDLYFGYAASRYHGGSHPEKWTTFQKRSQKSFEYGKEVEKEVMAFLRDCGAANEQDEMFSYSAMIFEPDGGFTRRASRSTALRLRRGLGTTMILG